MWEEERLEEEVSGKLCPPEPRHTLWAIHPIKLFVIL